MIPIANGLFLSSILFIIGLLGVMIHRNLLFILLSIEIAINSSAMMFIIASNYWNQVDGHIMYIFIITVAAVETSISLILILKLYHIFQNLNIEIINKIRE